ncbi:hypothetical protein Bca101_062124 [Brassica carinata]
MEQISFHSNPFLLSLLALFPIILFAVIKNKIKSKKLKLPPSPTKLPIIGNIHQIGNLPHKSLHDLSLKHGPFMFVNLGTTPYLVVSSADALEEMTRNHDIIFSNRPANTSLYPLMGNGHDLVYNPYGDQWKQIRKISALHLMSKNVVNRFQTLRDEEISSMLETINLSSIKGEEIDMSDMFNTVVTNVLHRSYTGSYKRGEMRGLESATRNFLNCDVKFKKLLGSFCFQDLLPSFAFFDRFTGFTTLLKTTYSELDVIMENLINQRKKESFVDVLLHQRDNDKLEYDVKAIMQVRYIYRGYRVCRLGARVVTGRPRQAPQVMRKAQDEVQRVVRTKSKISSNEIDQMHYLKCVIKETLRMHPPGIVPRETSSKWIKVGGYDIPPKTKILVNLFSVQRDAKYWENPEDYIPERFLDKNIEFMGTKGTLLLDLVVGTALFDWKMPDGSKPEELNMDEVSQFVVARKYPLKLIPVQRFKSNA